MLSASLNKTFPSFLTKCATERDPAVYRNVNRGGVALLIHNNNLIYCTSLLEIDSDCIIGAEVVLSDSTTICVLCVYLPSSNLSDDLLYEYLDMLEEFYIGYTLRGTVVIIGDMNVKIAGPNYVFLNDKRSDMFKTFISKHILLSVNVQSCCKGPVHIDESYTGCPSSAIDHILVPDELISFIINAAVDNDCSLSLSDHKQVISAITGTQSVHTKRKTILGKDKEPELITRLYFRCFSQFMANQHSKSGRF